MPTEADPIVHSWYQHLDKGQKFEVIAVDEPASVVEIQYFDGNVDQLDLDEWYDLEVEPIETPEDWMASTDNVEPDDLDYTETDLSPEDWADRLQEVKRPQGTEQEEELEEEEQWSSEGPREEPLEGEP